MIEKDMNIIPEFKRRVPEGIRNRVKKIIVLGARAREESPELVLDALVLLDLREEIEVL